MKIIVLAGGLSTERDVSLASAAGICRTLIEKGHDAFLLDVFLGLEHAPEHLEDVFTLPGHGLEIAKNISCEEPDLAAVKASRPDQSDCFLGPNVIELCRLADITFLGLHGGEGENGKLQATFDLLGIRYTGPDSLGCAVAMDKGLTKQVFLQAGIDTPAGVTIHKKSKDRSLALTGLSLPVVIKPCSGGSSIGVYIVSTEEEYAEALEKSFFYEDEVVVEEYIKGREFACGVIDNEALPPIEIIPKTGFFDYANKYQADATLEVCPADIPEETASRMMELTVKAFRALKLNVYSRADFLLDEKGNLYCLEMNTLPGMTAASLLPKEAKAAGIEYGDLCELIITQSQKLFHCRSNIFCLCHRLTFIRIDQLCFSFSKSLSGASFFRSHIFRTPAHVIGLPLIGKNKLHKSLRGIFCILTPEHGGFPYLSTGSSI